LSPIEIEGVALHQIEFRPSLAQMPGEIGVRFEGYYTVCAGKEKFC
jgi:hypothetical protein